MKTKTLTLISITLLALLVGGVLAFLATAPNPLTVNVNFNPNTFDLEAPGWTVKLVNVSLWFSTGKYKPEDIDPRTLLIEGVLGPKGGWKRTWIVHDFLVKKWVFRFQVSGSSLMDLVWTKIIHMDIPGPVATIPLQVTGNLYDGTSFEGTGSITVFIPTNPGPQPP